jgi:hypothetical protein
MSLLDEIQDAMDFYGISENQKLSTLIDFLTDDGGDPLEDDGSEDEDTD